MDHISLTVKYEKGKQIICFAAIIISSLGFIFDFITFYKSYTKFNVAIQLLGLLLCTGSLIFAWIDLKRYKTYFGIVVYTVALNILLTNILNTLNITGMMPNQTHIFSRDIVFIISYMAVSGFIMGPKHLIIQCIIILTLICYYIFWLKNAFVIENAAIYFLSIIGFTIVMRFVVKTNFQFISNLEEATNKYRILQEEAVKKSESLEVAYQEIHSQKEEITAQHDLVFQQKEQIEEIHQNLSASIIYAKRIQEAMLPSEDLISHNFNEYFIFYQPKDIVSGDFYWFCKINEYIVITIADCTGHGVPGALMSMLGISFLNEIVRKKEVTQASHILDDLRESIIDALKQKHSSSTQKDGMDMAICVINSETLQLQFAGANDSLYLIQKTNQTNQINNITDSNNDVPLINSLIQLTNIPEYQLIEFRGDKMPIGVYHTLDRFTNHEIVLKRGDILYLKSDGFEDQFGGSKGQKFLTNNLKKLLLKNCNNNLDKQKELLQESFNKWIGYSNDGNIPKQKYPQIDDITVMGIKI